MPLRQGGLALVWVFLYQAEVIPHLAPERHLLCLGGVVAGDFVGEEGIFPDGAVTAVVCDPFFLLVGAGAWDDDSDVVGAVGESPDDDVSNGVVVTAPGVFLSFAVAGEVAGDVGDAAVIDIRIRLSHVVDLWIGAEVGFHVLVNEDLEVLAKGTEASDNEVGFFAALEVDVACGVVDDVVGVVEGDFGAGAFEGGGGKSLSERGGLLETSDGLGGSGGRDLGVLSLYVFTQHE